MLQTACKKTMFTYKNNLFGIGLVQWVNEHNSEYNKTYLHNSQFSSVQEKITGRSTTSCADLKH